MNEFHFLRPDYLWLAVPFIILFIVILRRNRHGNIWQQVCSPDLIPYVLEKKSTRNTGICLLSFTTLSLLLIALAGPSWKQISYPLIKSESGLVIVLDLSDSMSAQDLKPSRLQRAIYKISDLLQQRKEGQTALIVFSGAPFVVTPLTDDVATIQSLLPALEPNIMPAAGHRVSAAIAKAGMLLNQAGIQEGSVLLVSAELSNEDLEKASVLATEHNMKVSVLGIGTETVTPIPKQAGGFVKDTSGALVMTVLAKKNLSQLANATNGIYTTITLDDQDINQITAFVSESTIKKSQEQSEMLTTRWLDEGYLFVLLALPLSLLFFRRGILAVLVLALPQTLSAFSMDDLWQTSDQRAQQLFHQKEYAQAKELFENPEWQAAATYHAQDYKTAATLYEGDLSVEGRYNYGTAKAKHGDFKEALEAYNQTLALQPDHEDALYNKKIIEDFLQQQEQNQSDQNDQKSDKKKDKNKNKNKDKTNQNQDDQQDSDEDSESDEEQEGQQNKSNKDSKPSKNEDSEQDQKPQDTPENQNDEQAHDENQANQDASPEVDEKQKEDLRQQFQEQMENESQETSPPNEPQPVQQQEASDDEKDQHQIDERWLECIQDDPGGLLRRKFLQQYRKQGSR